MYTVTSKFKQSVLNLFFTASSIGIRDNNIIYTTPTMILYEDMKRVLSRLMCTCKHCNVKLSLYYWTHWSCWWICHFKKQIERNFL